MRNVWNESCGEDQSIYFMFSNFFFRKACCLWDSVEKYGGAREPTNDDTTGRIRVSCLIRKATLAWTCVETPTHPPTRAYTQRDKYVIFITFPREKWLAKGSQCYVVRTLPVLTFLQKVLKSQSLFNRYWTPPPALGKVARRKAGPLLPSGSEVKMNGVTPPFAHTTSWPLQA